MGDTLGNTTAVDFGQEIDIIQFRVVDDGQIWVRVRIRDEATIGKRDVRVSDTSGSSTMANAFEVVSFT